MSEELRHEIELLKSQVAALTDERLPKVDRASKRRDRRQVLGGFGMFALAILMAGTLSASALSGSNTISSDDIIDGQVYTTDIRDSNVTGADVKNRTIAGADIALGTITNDLLATPPSGGGGSEIVARMRYGGPGVSVPDGGETEVEVPLTNGSFTQSEDETLFLFGEFDLARPDSCEGGIMGSPNYYFWRVKDGATTLYEGLTTLIADTPTRVAIPMTVLLESSTSTPRDIKFTVRFNKGDCTPATGSVTAVRLNALGLS